MVKLIACDLDGTLLDSSKKLPDRLFQVIGELKKRGVRFVAASGRQYYNLVKIFDHNEEDIIYLCENGGLIFIGGKPVYADKLSKKKLYALIQKIRQIEGCSIVLCGIQGAYIESGDQNFLQHVRMYYERNIILPNVEAALEKDSICKVAVFDPIGAEQNSYQRLKTIKDFNVCLSGESWVDLMNPWVNKGEAVCFLQRSFSISREECMAFGDYLNDYEMLKECAYSYAMKNAHPKLKEISKFEAASNDEDGVMKAIISFFGLSI